MRRWRNEAAAQNHLLDVSEERSTDEVRVEVELLSYGASWAAARGIIPEAEVPRFAVSAVVDTGATSSVLPASVAEQTDLFVDSRNRRLVGNSDHPDRKLHKVRTVAAPPFLRELEPHHVPRERSEHGREAFSVHGR
ncbi:MAG: hypothetical protein ACOCY8_02285 [Spirochaetota bacterium]